MAMAKPLPSIFDPISLRLDPRRQTRHFILTQLLWLPQSPCGDDFAVRTSAYNYTELISLIVLPIPFQSAPKLAARWTAAGNTSRRATCSALALRAP